LLATVILISGILVVTLRNVFHSALFLVLTFFAVAGIYLTLSAEFLAAVQVLIYVGAVTILILFAIMLTHQIESKSIRQVNEQVVPAAIISALFLALAIFAVTRTFGHVGTPPRNTGTWTAAIDADRLRVADKVWDWTASLEDKSGRNYIAGGNFMLVPDNSPADAAGEPAPETDDSDGYILSANSDFSTQTNVFGEAQTIYLKVWSDRLDYSTVIDARWTLMGHDDKLQVVTKELSNSNPETIGRLLMARFVLPFEVVSVLLLAALVGAIVIARKDK
jgi:NADH-quinone oxidoreductase subunit J